MHLIPLPSDRMELRPITMLVATVAVMLLPYSPRPATAQDVVEEVIVTAQFREQRLQDTPIAITAISAEELEIRSFTSTAEVGYTVPNASFRPAQAAYGNTMTAYIRGIGQYDFNYAFEPGVGIYIDDVYFPTTMGSLTDLMDLDRIEVLRGPQGTLFGRGSIGGAMRFVSSKPEGDRTGSLGVTYGAYNRVDVRGSYDFTIAENLYARVAGAMKQRNGYQDRIDFACANPVLAGIGDGVIGWDTTTNTPIMGAVGSSGDNAFAIPSRDPNRGHKDCKLGALGEQDQVGVRTTLRWVASDDVEFTLIGDYASDSGSTPNTLLATAAGSGPFQNWSKTQQAAYGVPFDSRFVPTDIYTSYATFDDPQRDLRFEPGTELEQWGMSGKLDWRLNDNMAVTAILSYREYSSAFANDHDASPLNEQLVNGMQEFESFTGELRLGGRLMDRLDYTIGYFHYEGESLNAQTVVIPAFQPPTRRFLVNGYNTGDYENNSVFGHFIYDLTDRLAITAGARYSEDKKAAVQDDTIVILTLDSKNNNFDYRFGLDYKLTDAVMIYASTATGYRPQAFNPRPFQPSQFRPVDGEEATAYELGIKGDFLDATLRTNIAGFYIDYGKRIISAPGVECTKNADGSIIVQPSGTPGAVTDPNDGTGLLCLTTSLTRYINMPGESYGVELETQWEPVDGLTFSGVFGLTEWNSDDVVTAGRARPPYVPKLNWALGAGYQMRLGNGGTVTPRFDVYGQSQICTNVLNVGSCSKGYELMNGRIEYVSPDEDWTLAVGVTNLTDKKYLLNRFDLTVFGQMTIEGQPGRPQEWYLSLRHSF